MSDEAKRRAAIAALAELPAEGVVGLGSGSTARLFVEELAPLVRAGRKIVGVATSRETRVLAESLGIPLADDAGPWVIDVTVDGADEVSDALDLVKGGGGAHTREKIVNHASKRNIIVVDGSKRVKRLGETRALPLEILSFGVTTTLRALERFGAVSLRGAPSDAGNALADVATGPIDDPAALERLLRTIPGVVETGLFVGRADVVLVAGDSRVERLLRRT
jgi:ribose 5-phosphate isomerase A